MISIATSKKITVPLSLFICRKYCALPLSLSFESLDGRLVLGTYTSKIACRHATVHSFWRKTNLASAGGLYHVWGILCLRNTTCCRQRKQSITDRRVFWATQYLGIIFPLDPPSYLSTCNHVVRGSVDLSEPESRSGTYDPTFSIKGNVQ